MACELKEQVIDGDKWSVYQMSATEALDLETRLAPLLMQAIVPVVASLGESDDTQSTAISDAIKAMFSHMPPKELAGLIRELCTQDTLKRNGEAIEFERDFSGGRGVMLRYRVAWFVLEANLGDFFAELVPEGTVERAKSMFAQQTGVESTGESGDHASQNLRSAS